ncbi:tRNA (adenosine(37)-N6)-threonylcarbamoyltransferase complex dimerization subunit type 1 TsaB [Kaustia mangrovi]|uniref:N(6)-L-threonylcarbamoyladenine synthase n=1 Tax=Kaustia mangrovi TaxID=2593653 RepID=A0A7S8HCA8_9HYPH|nr:tRNA (adenosine(37)-N6)-threonylcarbamoyltransferase complex dimerization subunit type 1 TsaB [Kaustia mangrovi]QPC43426.1 tRNA (adenosine(37)-N6)-threonylcarbamoyltransferase complex dimerization subunit type 1 TsaB [Kaustia mangrovi]
MKILALDTALDACSAAVVETEGGEARILAERCEPMVRGHAEALMPMVQAVMEEAGLAFAALDRIGVTVGPGTFTGVRIGLAAARGLALAADRPAVGVTSLEAIAANAACGDANPQGRPILAAIDARRGELYVQRFSAALDPLDEPRAMALEDARETLPFDTSLPVGTGAVLLTGEAGPVAPLPHAALVARRAALKVLSGKPPAPLYLRAPDAKPQASLFGPLRPAGGAA